MNYRVVGTTTPARLLPRRLPLVATAARQVQRREDAFEGERVVERWVRLDGLDVRVLLAARHALADAWVQLGQVAPQHADGKPLHVIELHHVTRCAETGETRSALLRRSSYLWIDVEAAKVAARAEAARLGIAFRETA